MPVGRLWIVCFDSTAVHPKSNNDHFQKYFCFSVFLSLCFSVFLSVCIPVFLLSLSSLALCLFLTYYSSVSSVFLYFFSVFLSPSALRLFADIRYIPGQYKHIQGIWSEKNGHTHKFNSWWEPRTDCPIPIVHATEHSLTPGMLSIYRFA